MQHKTLSTALLSIVDSPIFIVGANRSGTTLLRLLLNAHPHIAIPDELIYFRSRLAGIPIERWREPGLSAPAYESFVDQFLDENCGPLDDLNRAELKNRILDGPSNFKYPYQCALEAWAEHHGKERWGEKTPGNLFYLDILLKMFPSAQVLYMVRDPRAGVASMQKVSFFPDDVVFNALSRRKHDIDGRAHLRRHVPPSQRKTVLYEELVRHPESVLRSICDFLGVSFTPQVFRFHEEAGSYMKDEAEEGYNAAATQPITADRVDAWKASLAESNVAVIESICSEVMKAFGYDTTGSRLSWTRHGEILLKKTYWRVQSWRHRSIRDYTVKHPLFARTRSRLYRLRRWMSRSVRSLFPFQSS